MYLSKLELHGFKSFAQRTVIQFDPGITAIVGPNGCGKSNVVDAVRWVIGEQRARILRSEKMDNVIFNGTNKRKPVGMAEVLLTIQNSRGVLPTEYSEVTLGRRLFRSGESEYLLNGIKCRLQDITDLFMDTGMGAGAYSVIELKMVEEILSENAQDRRRLFEEAAGITKYKLRRKQALGKLETTQSDLTRLSDITEEIEKQVRSLKRQAEKAARFHAARSRLHRLECALARAEYDRLVTRRKDIESEAGVFRAQLDDFTIRETTEEAALEAGRMRLLANEEDAASRRKALGDQIGRVRTLEADARLEDERIRNMQSEGDRIKHELEAGAVRKTELTAMLERMASEKALAEPELEKLEAALQVLKSLRDEAQRIAGELRDRLGRLREQERQATVARGAVQSQFDRLTSRIEVVEREHQRATADLEMLLQSGGELEARSRNALQHLEVLRTGVQSAREAVSGAQSAIDGCKKKLEEHMEALRRLERTRDATLAEANVLQNLVASYEDFSGAVQFLATHQTWSRFELQTVADVVSCDEAHRPALQTALGEMAAAIVVRNDGEAHAAVEMLRSSRKGQATFILLDRLHDEAVPLPPIVRGTAFQPLRDLVRVAHDDFSAMADFLLSGCYLVESLERARGLDIGRVGAARFITPLGEWTDAGKLLHGGSIQKPSTMAARMGRRERLERLRHILSETEARLSDLHEQIGAVNQELRAVPMEPYQAALRAVEKEAAEHEKLSTRLIYEQESLDRRQQDLSGRIEGHLEELGRLRPRQTEHQTDIDAVRRRLEEAERERIAAEEAFHRAESESRIASGRFSEANLHLVQSRNRLENLRRDYERNQALLAELDMEALNLETRLETLGQAMNESAERNGGLQAVIERERDRQNQLHEAADQVDHMLREVRAEISNQEQRLRGIRQERERLSREANARAVRLAEGQTRLEDLVTGIERDYGLRLDSDDEAVVLSPEEESSARAEVVDLRRKIEALGAVNALALEEYEEQKARLDFLTSQQNDLKSAEATLLDTIKEINTTAAARFMETFDAVHLNFARIFSHLFGEDAGAALELVHPSDPLESAIEIMARPRGKRPTSIAQLSGGEKTLTAIALLFAIYLVKPSPFCILDEVDAPLDESNVGRFMGLIREFARDTQFILVTHNKRTMEAADRMYGITMQEQGVSTLVGVRFDELIETMG